MHQYSSCALIFALHRGRRLSRLFVGVRDVCTIILRNRRTCICCTSRIRRFVQLLVTSFVPCNRQAQTSFMHQHLADQTQKLVLFDLPFQPCIVYLRKVAPCRCDWHQMEACMLRGGHACIDGAFGFYLPTILCLYPSWHGR